MSLTLIPSNVVPLIKKRERTLFSVKDDTGAISPIRYLTKEEALTYIWGIKSTHNKQFTLVILKEIIIQEE